MAWLRRVRVRSRGGRKLVAALVRRGERVLDERVLARAGKIVAAVRRGGDGALVRAVRRYDGVAVRSAEALRLALPAAAYEDLPPGFETALERAITAVERYHRQQVRKGIRLFENGVELEERRTPLGRVGVYVPGGRAAYPSTVVMTVVPARLAGVGEVVVATPPASWQQSPALRFTLKRLEVEEIWGMGGAQAVAALAYGTESVRRVDKIVGPGNAWVTAAKHLVSAEVAIDGLAGPSEVVILASDEVDAELVAADLLAQAEHDPQALALLVTESKTLVKQVERALGQKLRQLATAAVAKQALHNQGAALLVENMEEGLALVEELAPEHLQLVGRRAEALADKVRRAGAVFVGESTPEVFGDYLAGPSHVLPTGGTARFASALGVDDFVRRHHVIRFDRAAAERSAAAAATLAEVEGLPAHAASARLRLGR